MNIQDMYVRLDGLRFYAYHGVLPQESQVGAEYTVNLRLKTDFTQAAQADLLDGTINYAEVFSRVKEEMSRPSRLLEHVSWRIASRLFADFGSLEQIQIEIFKQNPPMGSDSRQVGIEANYCR